MSSEAGRTEVPARFLTNYAIHQHADVSGVAIIALDTKSGPFFFACDVVDLRRIGEEMVRSAEQFGATKQ